MTSAETVKMLKSRLSFPGAMVSRFRQQNQQNGANGMSDIEGKVARVAATECGHRRSFNGPNKDSAKFCSFCPQIFSWMKSRVEIVDNREYISVYIFVWPQPFVSVRQHTGISAEWRGRQTRLFRKCLINPSRTNDAVSSWNGPIALTRSCAKIKKHGNSGALNCESSMRP